MLKPSALIGLSCLLTLTLHAARTPPQVLDGIQPSYPEELKKRGEMGEAMILARVDEACKAAEGAA